MDENYLCSIFKNSISFDEIDKSKYNLDNKSLKEQFIFVNIIGPYPSFYYNKCKKNFKTEMGLNKLNIQPRSIQNIMSLEDENSENLVCGDCIYDLTVKGKFISKANLKISSNLDYSIPFEKIDDNKWVLKKFTKSQPFMLGCMVWCKFYLELESDSQDYVEYSYSIIMCKNNILEKMVSGKFIFGDITYENGFIKILE